MAEENKTSRWERKKEKTQRKIISVALKLFKEQGFDETTMEQIAEETDIAKGTLYNYFSNKNAIIAGYMKNSVRDRESDLENIISQEPNTYARLTRFMLEMAKWNESNKDLVKFYASYRFTNPFQTRQGEEERSEFESILARIFKLGQEGGDVRNDISYRQLAKYFKSMYTVPMINWLLKGDGASLISSQEEMIRLFMDGAKGK